MGREFSLREVKEMDNVCSVESDKALPTVLARIATVPAGCSVSTPCRAQWQGIR